MQFLGVVDEFMKKLGKSKLIKRSVAFEFGLRVIVKTLSCIGTCRPWYLVNQTLTWSCIVTEIPNHKPKIKL